MDVVMEKLDVDINYTARGEHVPEAKRNNHTIVERICAHYHNLFYKVNPKGIVRNM